MLDTQCEAQQQQYWLGSGQITLWTLVRPPCSSSSVDTRAATRVFNAVILEGLMEAQRSAVYWCVWFGCRMHSETDKALSVVHANVVTHPICGNAYPRNFRG